MAPEGAIPSIMVYECLFFCIDSFTKLREHLGTDVRRHGPGVCSKVAASHSWPVGHAGALELLREETPHECRQPVLYRSLVMFVLECNCSKEEYLLR